MSSLKGKLLLIDFASENLIKREEDFDKLLTRLITMVKLILNAGKIRLILISRSVYPHVFCRRAILKIFGKFIGKQRWWRPILVKLQTFSLQLYENRSPPQIFFCEFSENFQSSCSTEHPWTAASIF